MRVAVASSGLEHVTRGVESWVADLAGALHARGAAVTLFKGSGQPKLPYEHVLPCWKRDAPATQRLLRWTRGRCIWRLGMGTGYGIEQTTFGLRLLAQLRDEHFDVLHVQDPDLAMLIQRAGMIGLTPTRVILAHGTNESPEFLRRVQFLQHLSPWQLEQARAVGLWKPTWSAIPNFVDTRQFAPGPPSGIRKQLGIPEEAIVVVSVAAIKDTHKRVGHVINEVAQLAAYHPPVHLVAAGSADPESAALITRGQQLLGERFHVLLNCPRQQMPDVYRAADIFVLGSLREMMPMAVLEATSSGLPCLLHAHPVLTWMMGPGGQTVDMASPGVLAGAIGALARDPARRRALGQAARQHCLSCFGSEQVVDQIQAYYRHVLN